MGFRHSPSANLFNAERWMEDIIVKGLSSSERLLFSALSSLLTSLTRMQTTDAQELRPETRRKVPRVAPVSSGCLTRCEAEAE